jgi:hypothetical protein
MTALLYGGGLRVAFAGAAVGLTVLLGSAPAAGSFVAVTSTGGSTVGTATSFCVSPGSQDVVVANDAWTDENAAAMPNATTTALQVQSAAGANRRTYLRFVLPGLPRHCRLAAAQLRLRASTPTNGRIVDVYRADPAQSPQWVAGTLSWSNQPDVAGTPSGSASLSGPGVQTWDVTAHTQALYGGTNNGFVLKDRTEGQPGSFPQAYDEQSTVGGTVPVLRLTWA